MPRASAGVVKYAYYDHDSDVVDEDPPILNTWYELFRAYDVRLLLMNVRQDNDETVAKDIEVRWTIDGNVYFVTRALPNATEEWFFREEAASTGGTAGLSRSGARLNAAFNTDKRGQDFKVEVRITEALGTNQRLRAWAVRETLEIT